LGSRRGDALPAELARREARLTTIEKDRMVTFTYRKPASTRPRTTTLDGMEFLRRFLPHVLPDGCMKVRHCGFLHARCASPPDTLCQMSLQADAERTPATARRLVLHVGRTDARRHAPVDLQQGFCRYRLRGTAWTGNARCDTVCNMQQHRASSSCQQAAKDH